MHSNKLGTAAAYKTEIIENKWCDDTWLKLHTSSHKTLENDEMPSHRGQQNTFQCKQHAGRGAEHPPDCRLLVGLS